jgi:hypothetical protein
MCEDFVVRSIVRGAVLPADIGEAETSCYTTAIGLTYNDISVGSDMELLVDIQACLVRSSRRMSISPYIKRAD